MVRERRKVLHERKGVAHAGEIRQGMTNKENKGSEGRGEMCRRKCGTVRGFEEGEGNRSKARNGVGRGGKGLIKSMVGKRDR